MQSPHNMKFNFVPFPSVTPSDCHKRHSNCVRNFSDAYGSRLTLCYASGVTQ